MKNTYRQTTKEDAYAIFGKVPPQAIEVEEIVLGAIMIEKNAYFSVCEILKSESFYKESNQIIFSAVKELADSGSPIDMITVTQKLKAKGKLEEVGGAVHVVQLTSKVASAGHIVYHAMIIAQKAIARELIRFCSERMAQAYDESIEIDDVITGIQDDLISVLETGVQRETTISESVHKVIERINRNRKSTGLTGIGTGLSKLDKITGGLQGTDLIVIAGETSQGKTSMALTILKNSIMRFGAKAAVYSLEMSDEQLTARIISQQSNVSAKNILNSPLSNDEHEKVISVAMEVGNLPVFFDPSSTSSVDQICASIRRLKMKHGINVVMVDYLQLISSNQRNKNDESQIAEITRKFKNIAKELNIPVVLISQLNRDGANHKPSKARLRGSGQIEEAADIILFVWRPEEYGIQFFDEPHENVSTTGLAQCIIAKGRNIGTGSFLLRFNHETTGFYDYAPEYDNAF